MAKPSDNATLLSPAPSGGYAGPSRRAALWLLVLVLALATWLRVHSLRDKSLWPDEGISGYRTLQTYPQIIAGLRHGDTGGPAYYSIVWLLLKLHHHDIVLLRLPAVLFGLASVALAYALAVELMRNRWAGLVAAMALAVNRFHIHHSMEARNYTLYFMTAVAAMYCLTRLARARKLPSGGQGSGVRGRGSGIRDQGSGIDHSSLGTRHSSLVTRLLLWAGFVLSGAAMIYTHNVSFFFLAGLMAFYALASWLGGRRWYAPPLELAAAGAMILVLYLPWLPSMLMQFRDVMQSIWIDPPTVTSATRELGVMLWQPTLAATDRAVSPPVPPETIDVAGTQLATAILVLVIAGWTAWSVRSRDGRAATLALCVVGTVAAIVGFSMVRSPIFMTKTVIRC